MHKENVENKFSADLDRCLSGSDISPMPESGETGGLLALGKALAGMDFSGSSDKEAVFRRVWKSMNMPEGSHAVKKPNRLRHRAVATAAFALVCAVSVSFMQTTFAEELLAKIIRSVSLGHITVLQTEPSQAKERPVPPELKGKIFDQAGNPIEVLTEEHAGAVYTAEGEKIVGVANGEIVTESQKERDRAERILTVKSPDALNQYTCFDVLLPGYLPEGYSFDRAELYKDEEGKPSPKYISLYFINEKTGKSFYMQQRFADEETAFEASTESAIEQIKINGIDAVLYDNANIHWEAGNVLYVLLGRDLEKDQLIAVAESVK